MFPFDDVIMYNDTWLIHMRGNNWYMNEKVGIKLNRHIILQYQVTGVMASGPKEHRMFVQQVVPANIKENTRALHYGPFVREIHRWRFTGGVPSQRASNAENVCTSHDVLLGAVHRPPGAVSPDAKGGVVTSWPHVVCGSAGLTPVPITIIVWSMVEDGMADILMVGLKWLKPKCFAT